MWLWLHGTLNVRVRNRLAKEYEVSATITLQKQVLFISCIATAWQGEAGMGGASLSPSYYVE